MPQTTNISLYRPSEGSCDVTRVTKVLHWLGSTVKRASLWSRRGEWVRALSDAELPEWDSHVAKDRWVMLKLSISPRIEIFLREHLAENPTSLMPPHFFGETSVKIGRHAITGQVPGGGSGPKLTSWLTVSLSGEGTPIDWRGFDEEIIRSKATKAILDEFRNLAPGGEVAVRYFA